MLVDTHCHIHEPYDLPIEEVLVHAEEQGVTQMICVGTSEESSKQALEFVKTHSAAFAAIGVHPHDTKEGYEKITELANTTPEKLVAIGEIGLDYFYTHSTKETQIEAL